MRAIRAAAQLVVYPVGAELRYDPTWLGIAVVIPAPGLFLTFPGIITWLPDQKVNRQANPAHKDRAA